VLHIDENVTITTPWADDEDSPVLDNFEAHVDIRDENALRACTVIVRTVGDTVQIEVQRIENDPRVEFILP
jgi:hypothetical protein